MSLKKLNRSSTRLCWQDRTMYGTINVLTALLLIAIAYPLIYVVSSSFSSGTAVSSGKVLLWPVDFSLTGYEVVFSYKSVWTGFRNTVLYTVFGTVLNMALTVAAAYPLSRKTFQGRNIYMTIFFITMVFSGGLIPTYMLMNTLGLVNSGWALILSGGISVYNMIIMRTFFQNSIPEEIFEAARIDGCSDFRCLFQIVLPLSKAILAVITMYYAVARWNAYFDAMIYLRDKSLYPLQLILRSILTASRIDLSEITDPELLAAMAGAADLMKYSLIVVATAPILVIYPFVQKYFEKGVMIGSVKG